MYCIQFWGCTASKVYFKTSQVTESTSESVLSLNIRANKKKTRYNFERVIWLAKKTAV